MNACPTPFKIAFPTIGSARRARGSRRNKGTRMRAYRCPAGHWHLTSEGSQREQWRPERADVA